MQNDAWLDDPDMRVVSDDDPDSMKMKAFLRRWVWPGVGGLALALAFVVLFKLTWAHDLINAAALLWLVGQLVVRPRAFITSFIGFFAKASGFMAGIGAPAIAWLNRKLRGDKPAAVQAFAASAAPVAEPTFAPQASAAAPVPPRPPKKPLNWRAALDGLLKWWWLIAILIGAIVLVNALPSLNPFRAPTGREVAAEYRAEAAENITRTTEAEAQRSAESVVIVERHNERRSAVRDQTEEAREAIAEAPDLDAQYREYRSRAERLRLDSGAATAAAVSEYHSSVDP